MDAADNNINILLNTEFIGNHADQDGGAVYFSNTYVFNNNFNMNDVIFQGNTAGGDGGRKFRRNFYYLTE